MKTTILFSALFSSQWLALLSAARPDVAVDRLVSRRYVDSEESHLARRDSGFSNGGTSDNTGKDQAGQLKNPNNFAISIYHVNDLHSRLDEFSPTGTRCVNPSQGCVGGYPRIKSVIDRQRPSNPHSLVLNAGDEFQGTLFHEFYRGKATADIINKMGFDAMTIGNHEFDDGDDVLATFLSSLKFPIVSANIRTTNKKLSSNIIPYQVFNTGKYRGMDLAIIGVTTNETPFSSRPGAGTTFDDPIASVKSTVDLIKRRHRGIKRIIALTHIGYENDLRLARESTGISLIVGGHSHTLLGNNATVPGATGPYPTIVQNANGEEVFVVTSYRYGEYLGYIDVEYDANGRIVRYEGAPIHLRNNVPAFRPENTTLKADVRRWAQGFEDLRTTVIGRTSTALEQATCQGLECRMGNLAADAIAGMSRSNLTSPLVNSTGATPPASNATFAGAIINAGGIRAAIPAGNIIFEQALEVFPFGNLVVDLDFTSAQLWNAFESIVSQSNVEDPAIVTQGFVQVSESIRFTFNFAAPVGSRLRSLTVANGQSVVQGDTETRWTIATINYLAAGGDGFWPPRSPFEWGPRLGSFLDDVFVEYLNALGRLQRTPDGAPNLNIPLDGRISRVST